MNKTPFLLLICAMFFISCLEEVSLGDFQVTTSDILMEAQLSNIDNEHRIRFYRPTTIASSVQESIIDIEVVVRDSEGNSYFFVEKKPGEYSSKFKIEKEKFYTLELKFPDGTTASSNAQAVPVRFPIDSISTRDTLINTTPDRTRFIHYRRSLGYTVHSSYHNLENDIYLRIESPLQVYRLDESIACALGSPGIVQGQTVNVVEYNYALSNENLDCCGSFCQIGGASCYIYEEGNTSIVNLSNLDKGSSGDFGRLAYTDAFDERYTFKMSTVIDVHSMTKEHYEFWSNIKDLNEQSGDITDKLPAKLQGNILDSSQEFDVVGYFGIVNTSRTVEFFEGLDLGGLGISPLCSQSDLIPEERCYNCLNAPGASKEKPDFW